MRHSNASNGIFRCSRNRIVFLLVVILIIAFIVSWNRFGQDITAFGSPKELVPESFPRLDLYCAKDQYLGAEGSNFPGKENFQLKKVVFTIRHGDRSSIHLVPNSRLKHSKTSGFLDPEASKHSKSLSSFSIQTLGNEQDKIAEDVRKALDSKFFSTGSDFHLSPGQLSSRGFMQHIRLGGLMNSAYGNFFRNLGFNDVYIRSTNYFRTIRSVAAFLIAALPDKMDWDRKLNIKVHASEYDELMHGIGLRSSSHNQNSSSHGEHEVAGQCKPAIGYARAQRKKFSMTKKVLKQLTEIFGNEVKRSGATELTDASLSLYCHDEPLPCSAKFDDSVHLRISEEPRCMPKKLLNELMEDADRYYCNRFTGREGGQNATNLAIYPFVNELLQHISPYAPSPSPYKLSVFSGHDTVIAPVLSALGIYKDELCRWPQYASRIVFEVYQRIEDPEVPQEPLLNTAHLFVSTHLPTGSPQSYNLLTNAELSDIARGSYFVRVIFNGEDVTQRIPECKKEVYSLASAISKKEFRAASKWVHDAITGNFTLCSVKSFTRQVQNMIAPHQTIEQACSMR